MTTTATSTGTITRCGPAAGSQVSVDSTHVTVGTFLAVQLTLSTDRQVADAAALAVAPEIGSERTGIRCSDAPYESLPVAERALAWIVAQAIDARPEQARVLGAVPFHEFLATKPGSIYQRHATQRVFSVEPPPCAGPTERRWRRRFAFTLPTDPAHLMWQSGHRRMTDRLFEWCSSRHGIALVARRPAEGGRASPLRIPRSVEPVLYDSGGRRDERRTQVSRRLVSGERIRRDSSGFLFDLASGRLAGSTIQFGSDLVEGSARVRERVVVSVEIGRGLDDIPIASLLTGRRFDRFRLDADGQRRTIPSLGGRTLAAIHRIAGECGTTHGFALRGSFAFHPDLRIVEARLPAAEGASR